MRARSLAVERLERLVEQLRDRGLVAGASAPEHFTPTLLDLMGATNLIYARTFDFHIYLVAAVLLATLVVAAYRVSGTRSYESFAVSAH